MPRNFNQPSQNLKVTLLRVSLVALAAGLTYIFRTPRKGDGLSINKNGIEYGPKHITVSKRGPMEARGDINNPTIAPHLLSAIKDIKAGGNINTPTIDPNSTTLEEMNAISRQITPSGDNRRNNRPRDHYNRNFC